MIMIMLIVVFLILSMIGNIRCLKISSTDAMRKMIAKTLVIMTVFNQQPSYGDIDIDSNNNDVSLIVPSRKTIVKIPDEDKNVQVNPNEQIESIDQVLNLIPSWKYFKIISKEYSSRSTTYKEGQENYGAPFM